MRGIYKKKLTGILACLTVVIMSGVNIVTTMSVDYYTMLYVVFNVLPYAALMGFFGYMMGSILDHPKNIKKKNKSSMRV